MNFCCSNDLRPGMPAQLYNGDGDVYVCISDGTAPIGIVDYIIENNGKKFAFINYSRQIINTNNFELNAQFPINANIYVSEKGLYTTRRPSPFHPTVGMVVSSPNLNGKLEFLWL